MCVSESMLNSQVNWTEKQYMQRVEWGPLIFTYPLIVINPDKGLLDNSNWPFPSFSPHYIRAEYWEEVTGKKYIVKEKSVGCAGRDGRMLRSVKLEYILHAAQVLRTTTIPTYCSIHSCDQSILGRMHNKESNTFFVLNIQRNCKHPKKTTS